MDVSRRRSHHLNCGHSVESATQWSRARCAVLAHMVPSGLWPNLVLPVPFNQSSCSCVLAASSTTRPSVQAGVA